MTATKLSQLRGFSTLVWSLLGLFALVIALPGLLVLPLHFVGLLLFGWVFYLRDVLPHISFNLEIALDALIAGLLAIAGLHRMLIWWRRKQRREAASWRLVSTLRLATIVLLLFATSIAATGIVHQVGWLFREEELTYDANQGVMTRELLQLKQVALGLMVYAQDFQESVPRDLEALIPEYLPDRAMLFSNVHRGEPVEMILYFPNNKDTDLAKTIILAGPQVSASGKRTIATRDATAMIVQEAEFQKLLRQQASPSAGSTDHP